jgi:flagellar biosynthesis/type III secretory pathway protein FliH
VATSTHHVEPPAMEADFPVTPAGAEPPVEGPGADQEFEALWDLRFERELEKSRIDVYNEGFAAASVEIEAQYAERIRLIEESVVRIDASWRQFLTRCEPAMVDLSFAVAEKILEAPLPDAIRRSTSRAIAEAVEQLAIDPPVSISLHPVDLLQLQEAGAVEQIEALHTGLRWEPDARLKTGEWVVRSATAVVRRLEHELMARLQSLVATPDFTPGPEGL